MRETDRFWTMSTELVSGGRRLPRHVLPSRGSARSLDSLEDKSETAVGFIEYVGTTVPPNTPTTGAMVLLAIVAIIILAQIWTPKK